MRRLGNKRTMDRVNDLQSLCCERKGRTEQGSKSAFYFKLHSSDCVEMKVTVPLYNKTMEEMNTEQHTRTRRRSRVMWSSEPPKERNGKMNASNVCAGRLLNDFYCATNGLQPCLLAISNGIENIFYTIYDT